MAEQTFTLTLDGGIAIVEMDVQGESMNTLKAEFADELDTLLTQIEQSNEIKLVLICSGKPDSFVAGADISMIDACQTRAQGERLSLKGHEAFARLSRLSMPVVAAIHGPCLGGGLELALACDYRVCSDSEATLMGLPEVQLGLLPGGGGTQRLPQLVGLQKALEMMLTGKQLRPNEAKRIGLVDEVVPLAILREAAAKYTLKPKQRRRERPRLQTLLLEKNLVGRRLLLSLVRKKTLAQTQGNYPAPMAIIDCVEAGVEGVDNGYGVEAKEFGRLAQTPQSQSLRALFFASTELKKEVLFEGVKPSRISQVGVLGGGLMGAGIAFLSGAKNKARVRVKDVEEQGVNHALGYAYKRFNAQLQRRFITPAELGQSMSRITGSTDFSGFKGAQIVIEAVFESLALKQQMVAEVEVYCSEQTIFASNTSSLPIHQIAAKASRPEQVIGLHYFSPAEKMPLVEVIPHAGTSEQVITDTLAFARKQGKTAIVVKDKAGFYVNRILAPYMNEAAHILLGGEPIDRIDKALLDYGFPVGPLMLLDEVGIDVGAKISPILESELGARFKAPQAFGQLLKDNRLGKKNCRGFYDYHQRKNAKKRVDESVYGVLGVTPSSKLEAKTIAERCALMMFNEAARCLDEAIIRSPRDGDLGAIFGIGFPPFLGGPFRAMDSLGCAKIVERLRFYEKSVGERFAPCEALLQMAGSEGGYYP
jgi:3-hydroxyacyl-CoA dehydrogenase/enoyl-CoA hydratase/3-hydroxybutyryl-CoA epimerase